MINLGRIAALMAYCYRLCKTYITREMASSSLIVSFMGLVSGWLFKFFIKARFYEWLRNQGGWVRDDVCGGRGGGGGTAGMKGCRMLDMGVWGDGMKGRATVHHVRG